MRLPQLLALLRGRSRPGAHGHAEAADLPQQVRIPLECRCEVTAPGGATTQYVLSASCKTERVAVERDLFNQPNADFCVISSQEHYMIVKRWSQVNMQIERSAGMAGHLDRQGQGDPSHAIAIPRRHALGHGVVLSVGGGKSAGAD